jgi:hypothetical protein
LKNGIKECPEQPDPEINLRTLQQRIPPITIPVVYPAANSQQHATFNMEEVMKKMKAD